MHRLFFHEESIHEVSRQYLEHEYIHTYIHTYGQAETNMPPHFFKVGGIKKWGGGGGVGSGGGGSGWGGQGGCEWRSESFVKIQKKIIFFGGWGLGLGGGEGRVGGGVRQGGWEQRSAACVKIQKKNWGRGGGGGGSVWGVRVDVNGEVKLL